MKTAISLPDHLFYEAEAYAQRKGLSRSELYAYALQLFLKSQQTGQITAALDALYSDETSALEPDLRDAQRRLLKQEDW